MYFHLPMKRKRTSKKKIQEAEQTSDRSGKLAIMVIVLFALLGLTLGYMMFKDVAGNKPEKEGPSPKIEKKD